MLGGATHLTTLLGAAPPADADTSRLKAFARAASDVGLALLLIEPGGKRPVDMRSATQRRNEDGAAQDAARAAGKPNWDRARSLGGVHLATTDTTLLGRYLDRYRNAKEFGPDAAVNFGIDVGKSRLIVVDCDTAEQVEAFRADFEVPDLAPTVSTPGEVDSDGVWSHSNGGHFYFTVPDGIDIPTHTGSLTAPGGYVVLWAHRYVLIPPSVRPEGAYRLTGRDFPAPRRLLNMIAGHIRSRVDRRAANLAANSDVTEAVDAWAATISWADVLEPAGWTLTAKTDNCGCEVWTAPGDHASPKSATAHDAGCSLGRYTTNNAPLHIWTDYPGAELEAWTRDHGKTLSLLQATAVLQYGGDVGEAMRRLNVVPSGGAALGFGADIVDTSGLGEAVPEPTASPAPEPDPFSDPGVAAEQGATAETPEAEARPVIPLILPFNAWRDTPQPTYIIDGLIENGGFTSIIGPPGVGKSAVALSMLCAIATGQRWLGRSTLRANVLYLPGEGLAGAVGRILAWEHAHDIDVGDPLFMGDSIMQIGAPAIAWAALVAKMLEFDIGLLMLDTFGRAAAGLEENSARDVGLAVSRLDQVRAATGAGVALIHHTRKDSSSGRGSSALQGALDTELIIRDRERVDGVDGEGRTLELDTTKQKNAPLLAHPIPMLAKSHGDSFVITGPSGIVDDPLDQVVLPALRPERAVEIAIRVRAWLRRYPTQGATRGEVAYGVEPDAFTAARRDAKTAWKLRVGEAIDLGLRYGLIQTLTGTPTGARYVPDATTDEAARERWAKEGIDD